METVLGLITAITGLVAVLGVAAGFFVYERQKRDVFANETRRLIAAASAGVRELVDRGRDYEIVHEVVRNVVYAEELAFPLAKALEKCHDNGTEDGLQEHLKGNFPTITVAISSPIVRDMHVLSRRVTDQLAGLYHHFPALYRVIETTRGLAFSLLRGAEEAVRDNEIFEPVVSLVLTEKPAAKESLDGLRSVVCAMLTSGVANVLRDRNVRSIIEMSLELMETVIKRYMDLSERELWKEEKYERKREYASLRKTDEYSEDYKEALKGLDRVLTPFELERYRDYLTEFERVADELEKSGESKSEEEAKSTGPAK